MKGSELIVKFIGGAAYLLPDIPLDIETLGLPPLIKKQKQNSACYWVFDVIKFDGNENSIFGLIKTYNYGDCNFPDHQLTFYPALQTIKKLSFRTIDTTSMLWALHSKQETPVRAKRPTETPRVLFTPEETVTENAVEPIVTKPVIYTFNETIDISFDDLNFCDGLISFEWSIPKTKISFRFEIANLHVIEAFDAIKCSFSSALGLKMASVTIQLELVDGDVTKKEASSHDLSRIDSTLIMQARWQYVSNIFGHRNKKETDRVLHNSEELFSLLSDRVISLADLYASDSEFFEELLKIKNTKHYHYLTYLSKRHASDLLKLRFSIDPLSFMFLIEGAHHLFFVWETLDTKEATYIWRYDKQVQNIKEYYGAVNNNILSIRNDGKNMYIKRNDVNFLRIHHEDYSKPEASFDKWKREVEKVII